jgi:hypothetical protein
LTIDVQKLTRLAVTVTEVAVVKHQTRIARGAEPLSFTWRDLIKVNPLKIPTEIGRRRRSMASASAASNAGPIRRASSTKDMPHRLNVVINTVRC